MTSKWLAGGRLESDEESYVPWGVLSCELRPIAAAMLDRSLAQFAILVF
jgi:hypothetical protein